LMILSTDFVDELKFALCKFFLHQDSSSFLFVNFSLSQKFIKIFF
jgi:hypothetical protein